MTIGKGALSLKKKDFATQKSISTGMSKVIFAHKAAGGETSINLASLTTPTEMSSQGFVQPSAGLLADLNILFYRRNLTIESSLSGVLMDFLTYNVKSNTIISLNYTLTAGEILTFIIDPAPRSDLLVVDGDPIAATGELAVSAIDFNVGTAFEVNKYPTQQIGAVKVYRDGKLQARCEGNSLSNTGNYIEVPVSGGLGTLIRFKNAPTLEASGIIVTANGALIERPNGSMMAVIESLAGQVDKMIPVLADAAGVAESAFQGAPNNVNLKQFGDTVVGHTTQITALQALIGHTAMLRDEKANNTAGQNLTSTYAARHLNVLKDPYSIVLNPGAFTGIGGTNAQFQLGAGTYRIVAKCPVAMSAPSANARTKSQLFNVTDAAVASVGTSEYVQDAAGNTIQNSTWISDIITIAATKTFEVRQKIQGGTQAGGAASNFTETELYTTVEITKLA